MISYENNVNANLIITIEATMAVDNPMYRRVVRRKRRHATPAPYNSPLRRPRVCRQRGSRDRHRRRGQLTSATSFTNGAANTLPASAGSVEGMIRQKRSLLLELSSPRLS